MNYIKEVVTAIMIMVLAWSAKTIYDTSIIMEKNNVIIERIQEDVQENTDKIDEIDEDISTLGTWKASTEASRFTADDGKAVWSEIYQIRQDIAVIKSTKNLTK